jgi:Ca2+-transporting ATPase
VNEESEIQVMNGNLVTIVKDGNLINIDEDNLRTDDRVVLQTEDIIPADLKLVEANGLEIDEFEITGGIMPVVKKVGDDDAMIYMGSRIIKGTGIGVVVATGEQTEYGRILKPGKENNNTYEFRIIGKKYLVLIGLLLPAFIVQAAQSHNNTVVIVFYLLLSVIFTLLQNDELVKYLLVSTELKNYEPLNIQIRDMRALERMNKVDTICFDKTGVLTTRQMDVKNVYFADGVFSSDNVPMIDEGSFHLIKFASALCNDVLFFEKLDLANPIDKALISFALKNGINVKELLSRHKRIYDQPFDSENRYMVCGFEIDHEEYYFAKGDPEVISRMCNSYMTVTGAKKNVGFEFWRFNHSNIEAISQSGDTVIALAYASDISDKIPTDYTFLCLLQLENPLQPGVRETIKGITEKGIRSILLTGDRSEIAVRIGEECGITMDSKSYLTGRTMERMEPSEVARQSSYCSVFTRLLPSQKGFLIRLLQQKGHCIAMVGDGANDGVALKAADIGISYVKNSSPLARRLSKILINDLADLLRLVEGADRIERKARQLKLFRILIIAASLLSLYGWVFTSNTLIR